MGKKGGKRETDWMMNEGKVNKIIRFSLNSREKNIQKV